MEEYRINEYLTLKLENSKTSIYVNGKKFDQCKYLLLINPSKNPEFELFGSIDELSENFSTELEMNLKIEDLGISYKEEFIAHCSNLHVWVENNYDTRLLHSNLSFPLLKKLTDIGDPVANKVFKEEIAKRLESGYPSVIEYLVNERYIDYLEKDELFFSLLEPQQAEVLLSINKLIKNELIEPAVRLEEDVMPHLYFIVKNRKITALRLWYLPIQVLPTSAVEEISKLSSLEALQLSNHNVEEIPDSFSNLQRLDSLDLNEIFIGVFPESITKLANLRQLNLSHNYISSLPKSISELKSLKILDLGLNRIKTLDDSINSLSNLEVLKLNSNNISELPTAIGNLRKLKDLELYYNHLTALTDSIENLEALEILNISNNKLISLPKGLSNLKSLRILDLRYNPYLGEYLKERLLEDAINLKELRAIYLDEEQRKMIPISSLKKLRNRIKT